MIRNCLAIFLIVFFSQIAFTQIKDYTFTLIKTIPNGAEVGSIGWDERAMRMGGSPGPRTFTISYDDKIYLPDLANERINIYDLNLNYLLTIIENTEYKIAHFTQTIKIDSSNNLITIGYNGVLKLESNGDRAYYIERDDLPDHALSSRNFFPIDDHVFFYDEYGYVRSIDPQGVIQKPGRSMEVLKEINQQQMGIEKQALDSSIPRASSEDVRVPATILQDRKHIIVGDQFFSTSEYKTGEYYKELEKANASVRSFSSDSSRGIDIDMSGIRSRYLQGYDDDKNSYWIGIEKSTRKQLVLIYSNTGTILDAFYYDDINENIANNIQSRKVAIAPNGDVYFMRISENGTHFWKVERRW